MSQLSPAQCIGAPGADAWPLHVTHERHFAPISLATTYTQSRFRIWRQPSCLTRTGNLENGQRIGVETSFPVLDTILCFADSSNRVLFAQEPHAKYIDASPSIGVEKFCGTVLGLSGILTQYSLKAHFVAFCKRALAESGLAEPGGAIVCS